MQTGGAGDRASEEWEIKEKISSLKNNKSPDPMTTLINNSLRNIFPPPMLYNLTNWHSLGKNFGGIIAPNQKMAVVSPNLFS